MVRETHSWVHESPSQRRSNACKLSDFQAFMFLSIPVFTIVSDQVQKWWRTGKKGIGSYYVGILQLSQLVLFAFYFKPFTFSPCLCPDYS